MDANVVIESLLGLITVIIAFTSFYLATQATRARGKASAKAIDAGAFQRAREIYEGALDTLRDELAAARSELISTRNELTIARNELISTRDELTSARNEIASLRADIQDLRVRIEGLQRQARGPGAVTD